MQSLPVQLMELVQVWVATKAKLGLMMEELILVLFSPSLIQQVISIRSKPNTRLPITQ